MLLFHPQTEHMRFSKHLPPGEKEQKGKSFVSRLTLARGLSARFGNGSPLYSPPLSSADGRSWTPHQHLLDVVQTAGVGFEDGRVVEHLIERDAQEDDVELEDTATPTLG